MVLSGCKVTPDFTKNGQDYIVTHHCIQSHDTIEYGYHYGYNMMEGKFNYHFGMHTETICDSMKLDTIEVNIK